MGARRVDDRQTHTQTDKQTQAIIRAILWIGPTDRQINAGNNNGNPSDRANRQTDKPAGDNGPILPPF